MSRTLTLIPAGWDDVRAAAERGGRAGALGHLERVLARPDVPAALAASGHRLAAELALDLGRFALARRHARAARAFDATDAGLCFLLGRAWEDDPDGCDRRAAVAFKKAVALDPARAAYRAHFGRAAARCGKVTGGAREMRAALEAAPGDRAVVRVAVQGLIEAGQTDAARQAVVRARFLSPGCGELAALAQRVNFEAARRTQRAARNVGRAGRVHTGPRTASDARIATDGDRAVLPFPRRDGPSAPRPHLARPTRARKADW
ncbi:MAG: hypothetical protein FJ304_11650 [Planctomycetes bacterium]|nr:hypothetical protein [Planctomycetota bacterium]